ncbi:MAG: glycosyltransferase [Oscillospiraceae bacterium]
MKVCIIGHTEKNYLPFIQKYIDFFEQNNIEYDCIYWQREEKIENTPKNEYNYYGKMGQGFLNKIKSYFGFKKFVTSVIQKNKYDKLVVLTTVPAVMLSKYLFKHYKNKYIFDFRDYSFEKFPPYKKLVDKIIDNSEFTTISSKGFMDFLEDNQKIYINHNMAFSDNISEVCDIKNKPVLNVGFIGNVRYYEENIALIEKLKNSFNYQLWYIGKANADCNLEGYCKENDINNVSFVGKYSNDQKPELYKNIDVINSIYGDTSLEVTTALPNRLYEACLFKKPIISSKKTYLGEVIALYNLGIVVDVEKDDVLPMINDYVKNFDVSNFKKGCQDFINDVKNDEKIIYSKLDEFIK